MTKCEAMKQEHAFEYGSGNSAFQIVEVCKNCGLKKITTITNTRTVTYDDKEADMVEDTKKVDEAIAKIKEATKLGKLSLDKEPKSIEPIKEEPIEEKIIAK
jgi:hypothetical protein